MSVPILMRDIAWAAAWDAGSRSASAHGRTIWTEEDYAAAVDEFLRLWKENDDDKKHDAT